MTSRITQAFEEDLRRQFSRDLFTDARLLDNKTLLRNVDEDAINRCRLSTYGQMRSLNRRMVEGTEDELDVERERGRTGSYDQVLNVPIYDDVERIYFETYGEGFDGSPVVDRPGAPYTCPCGTKMMMVALSLPEQCPKCRRLTPLGRLVADGVLRRRRF